MKIYFGSILPDFSCALINTSLMVNMSNVVLKYLALLPKCGSICQTVKMFSWTLHAKLVFYLTFECTGLFGGPETCTYRGSIQQGTHIYIYTTLSLRLFKQASSGGLITCKNLTQFWNVHGNHHARIPTINVKKITLLINSQQMLWGFASCMVIL